MKPSNKQKSMVYFYLIDGVIWSSERKEERKLFMK